MDPSASKVRAGFKVQKMLFEESKGPASDSSIQSLKARLDAFLPEIHQANIQASLLRQTSISAESGIEITRVSDEEESDESRGEEESDSEDALVENGIELGTGSVRKKRRLLDMTESSVESVFKSKGSRTRADPSNRTINDYKLSEITQDECSRADGSSSSNEEEEGETEIEINDGTLTDVSDTDESKPRVEMTIGLGLFSCEMDHSAAVNAGIPVVDTSALESTRDEPDAEETVKQARKKKIEVLNIDE